MEHNLDNFYQNKWIRSCFGDSYHSNDSQLNFHDTSGPDIPSINTKLLHDNSESGE